MYLYTYSVFCKENKMLVLQKKKKKKCDAKKTPLTRFKGRLAMGGYKTKTEDPKTKTPSKSSRNHFKMVRT